jgi:hypothetical protein
MDRLFDGSVAAGGTALPRLPGLRETGGCVRTVLGDEEPGGRRLGPLGPPTPCLLLASLRTAPAPPPLQVSHSVLPLTAHSP